jgi:hypothetical protein
VKRSSSSLRALTTSECTNGNPTPTRKMWKTFGPGDPRVDSMVGTFHAKVGESPTGAEAAMVAGEAGQQSMEVDHGAHDR